MLTRTALGALLLLVTFLGGETDAECISDAPAMSAALRQIMLRYSDVIELNLTGPRPLYRQDLPEDYVAYWEVQTVTEFAIFSAGPQTGDRELVYFGDLPTVTSKLDTQAAAAGETCCRYYVLDQMANTMCRNDAQKIVATINIPNYYANETQSVVEMVEANLDVDGYGTEWVAYREQLDAEIMEELDLPANISGNTRSMVIIFPISPGEEHPVAVGDPDTIYAITLEYPSMGTDTSNTDTLEALLCSFIKGCTPNNDGTHTLTSCLIEYDSLTEGYLLTVALHNYRDDIDTLADGIFFVVVSYNDESREITLFSVFLESEDRRAGVETLMTGGR